LKTAYEGLMIISTITINSFRILSINALLGVKSLLGAIDASDDKTVCGGSKNHSGSIKSSRDVCPSVKVLCASKELRMLSLYSCYNHSVITLHVAAVTDQVRNDKLSFAMAKLHL
jgi:exo-beta-1,3-glucanase (GH17 family)